VVHCLFVAIVRPSISFASLVWWPGCQTASVKKRLSIVQKLTFLWTTGKIITAPAGAMDAQTPLERVLQGEATSAAHRLWRLRCWFYFHPNQEHSCILTRLQKSDPIFNMGIEVMKPVFKREPKYRVTV
jgi:hypothetical protein